MEGQTLDAVDSDLGIMISSDVKSSNQCIQACSKASKMLGMITRAHHRDEKPERDLTYHLTCLLIYHGTHL